MRNSFFLFIKITLCSILIMVPMMMYRGCVCYFDLSHDNSTRTELHYGDDGTDTTLLVVQDERGKYGFSDLNGNIVIQPKFDDARPFCEEFAAVCINDLWGYIDKTGKVVIPIRYWDATYFHNGKAFVSPGRANTGSEVDSLRCNLIDTKGKVVQKTEFYYVYYYKNIYMCTNKKSVQYLDSNYNCFLKRDCEYDDYYSLFSNGLALATINYEQVCYIDTSGNVVINTGATNAMPFSEGLAAVYCNTPTAPDTTNYWTYIDNTGKRIIQDEFLEAGSFSEGVACVKTKDGKWVIIDTTGRKIASLPEEIEKTGAFSEGLCAVECFKSGSYFWGYTDKSGKLVINYNYSMTTPFKNGIAEVLKNNRIAYIDKTGKYIWEPK